ncbi:unnamed protein product, partial [Amoebophrya sp. A25]
RYLALCKHLEAKIARGSLDNSPRELEAVLIALHWQPREEPIERLAEKAAATLAKSLRAERISRSRPADRSSTSTSRGADGRDVLSLKRGREAPLEICHSGVMQSFGFSVCDSLSKTRKSATAGDVQLVKEIEVQRLACALNSAAVFGFLSKSLADESDRRFYWLGEIRRTTTNETQLDEHMTQKSEERGSEGKRLVFDRVVESETEHQESGIPKNSSSSHYTTAVQGHGCKSSSSRYVAQWLAAVTGSGHAFPRRWAHRLGKAQDLFPWSYDA